MWPFATRRGIWGSVALVLMGLDSALFPRLQAEDRLLTVTLASGRQFTAEVDARTGDELWLRFSSGRGSILRPVAWNRITAARLGNQMIETEDLKRTCEGLKSPSPKREVPANPPSDPPTAPPPPPTVAFLRIDAWVANWDADVEPDGICLQLEPCDENGELVAVSGTADVELFAAQEREFHEAPQSGGWSTELIERWSKNVEEKQIGPRGVQLKLPWGAIHPDFSTGLDDWGLLHVRFVVPGNGVFEQSLDGLRLRTWSPVRERMYLQDGRWFFSIEGTQRN